MRRMLPFSEVLEVHIQKMFLPLLVKFSHKADHDLVRPPLPRRLVVIRKWPR